MERTPTQELLAHAEKLCAQRNVRLTPQRLEVLRLMSLQKGQSAHMTCWIYYGKLNHRLNRLPSIVRSIFCSNKVLSTR